MTPDQELRRVERAWRADPTDPETRDRYLRLLVRSGRDVDAALQYRDQGLIDQAPPEVLRQASRRLLAAGRYSDACSMFRIRWEVDPDRLLKTNRLVWRGRFLDPATVEELIGEDLRRFAPDRLADHFPRRADGRFRLNTTRFLRRYRAHEPNAAHRRLILIAWTPGTATLYDRPEDRGRHVVTVGLETRATRGRVLPPTEWGREELAG